MYDLDNMIVILEAECAILLVDADEADCIAWDLQSSHRYGASWFNIEWHGVIMWSDLGGSPYEM